MKQIYRATKVKSFRRWSKEEAMGHLGITEDEYGTIAHFIAVNKLTSKRVLHMYVKDDGSFCVSLTVPKWVHDKTMAAPSTDSQVTPKGSEEKKMPQTSLPAASPANQKGGDYIETTIQPGAAPYIQSHTTDQRLTRVLAVVSIIGATCGIIWQFCNIIFIIQDRRTAKARPMVSTRASSGVTSATNSDTNTL